MSDPIANMINQIGHANHKFIENIDMPASKLKVELARVLKEEGFIANYKVSQDANKSTLKITMKFTAQKERAIQGIRRISKPGLRIYKKGSDLRPIQNGLGTSIVSTSKGLMPGTKAKQSKIGGEVLCEVW